jgi:hypothetical protein
MIVHKLVNAMTIQNKPSNDETSAAERPTAAVPPWLVPGIFLTLLAWGLYLAIGASFPKQGNVLDDPRSLLTAEEPGEVEQADPETSGTETKAPATPLAPQTFRPQPQRGLVVAICFAIFIAWFWGLQRLYQKRHPRT